MGTMEELLLIMQGEMDVVQGADYGGHGGEFSDLLKKTCYGEHSRWKASSCHPNKC